MATRSKMRVAKPHRVVKPKKNTKRTTESSRQHRFQSFSERIANLRIDPIRRRRHEYDQQELSGNTDTYFGRSLQEWRDVNLSEVFVSFAKEAEPLCDSLAIVVHNEDKIMDILISYIQKREPLAMEPLLDLLSNFAHDLNSRFERHFQRGVVAVLEVAASHPDPAVIEWSFTCLAWLFKYLSRLLTPDLKPLCNLMGPYLGIEDQKPFIIRFSAEAFSYLIRRAAVSYERDAVPLDSIIFHMLQLVQTHTNSRLLPDGIMTVLTEAIRGVQQSIHSNGISILKSLLAQVDKLSRSSDVAATNVVCGTLTSLLHHCTAQTFTPALLAITGYLNDALDDSSEARVRFASAVIFTICSVRKGTRIADWKIIAATVKKLIQAIDQLKFIDSDTVPSALGALAVVLQYASVDAALSLQGVLEIVRNGRWISFFIQFCDLVARLDHYRFNTYVLPHFQRFIVHHWKDKEQPLLSTMPRLANGNQTQKFSCPTDMVDLVLSKLQKVARDANSTKTEDQYLGNVNEALSGIQLIAMNQNQTQQLRSMLHEFLAIAFQKAEKLSDNYLELALGPVLPRLVSIEEDRSSLLHFWPSLCVASSRMYTSERFWTNLLHYIKLCKPTDLGGEHMICLQESISKSLCLPSHSTRSDCLDILQYMYDTQGNPVPAVLLTAITIESIPITLETARSISMNIRKLSIEYDSLPTGDIMSKALPSYLYGLLHLNLSQAWLDAIGVMATICKSKFGEEVVVQIAQAWLEGTSEIEDEKSPTPEVLDINTGGFKVLSDFECPNLAKLTAIRDQVFMQDTRGSSSPYEKLAAEQKRVPILPALARSMALKVFSQLPQLAEKRSRLLVPVLLKWTNIQDADDTSSDRWSRKDQKAMLAIFAQFVNPKVLFQSGEVYEALLVLCMNGDVEIQTSALKTILSWKDSAIVRYKENLTNLLDEVRFREEISVFLRDDSETEGEGIRQEDLDRVMPVLLRLLYGRAIAGKKEGQAGRRKALFVALSRFGQPTLGQFLDIALSPFQHGMSTEDKSNIKESWHINIPYRKQVGVLNMLSDMLGVLGAELEPFQSKLIGCIVPCTAHASAKLNQLDATESVHDVSLLRTIRQTGLQCLGKIFSNMTWSGSKSQLESILTNIVTPRLRAFEQENLQSVSGILRLLAAWAQDAETSQFVYSIRGDILSAIARLLSESHAKDEVRLYILRDILDALLQEEKASVLSPCISEFVTSIGSLIDQDPSKEVLDAGVKSLTGFAPFVQKPDEATRLARICTDLLKKSSRVVSPYTKTGLMKILLPLIANFDITSRDELYVALCALYSRLRGPESRLLITQAIASLIKGNIELQRVAGICDDLNAMGGRLDEPDHKRREKGFNQIYDSWESFSLQQWLPIVHNAMFYIRDGEDRVNRSSAAHVLQLLVDAAAAGKLENNEWRSLLDSTIFPAIERGMLEPSELVRTEYLLLLGRLVEKCPSWPKVNSLQSLLVGGDEEASVFTNVLHIQHHRRLRAVRRLADEAHQLSSSHVTKVFLPLIEHFVFDQVEGDTGRTLADQAVTTIGSLAKEMNLSSFRATFRRYTGYLTSKEDMEKIVLRLLGALVDGFTQRPKVSELESSKANEITSITTDELLPPLLKYLHLKDESTVDRRMPVAISIVKLLQLLPEIEFRARLPPVLTDVSHVLRSRSQEARDQTRKTLITISSLIGPTYFGFILKELRGALKRGYQLHVLSFTVHSLLIDANGLQQPGNLDFCLYDLMAVIMDDIFGATGQEKDADEYRSTMKEVKSSKSFDSMELLAKVVPIPKLGQLIRPIQALLCEKMDIKTARKSDELLIRLRRGLDQNAESDSRDVLTFCWEIVREVYTAESAAKEGPKKLDERVQRYLIQPEEPKKSKNRGATTSHIFKLFSFALNLVRKVVRRHEDLQTPANMAGFLPMIGDALVQGQEEVKLAAVKLLSTIMKVPMPELEANAPVYVKEAMAMVKGSSSINTDTAKAALELITSVLREKHTVTVKERDIGVLIKAIKADVDEPDRQTVIYKFLRAVLHRKIVITEVYEVMDELRQVMITNPDRSIRDSARSAYLQFVMGYPQSKERWSNQAEFLKQNLKYEHATGRQSVMEILHQLSTTISEEVFSKLASTIFVPLVLVHVGDSDAACREMAAILLAKLFERASDEGLASYFSILDQWLESDKKPAIRTAAFQCLTILLPNRPLPKQRLERIYGQVERVVAAFVDSRPEDTQLVLRALQTFDALLTTAREVALSRKSATFWKSLQGMPSSADAEVHELTAQLLGIFFSDVASASSKSSTGLAALPLRGSNGLTIDASDMRRLCSTILRAIRVRTSETRETLMNQCVRNLVFLGRCFAANDMNWDDDQNDEDDQDNDDDEDDESEDETSTQQQSPERYTALAYLLNRLSAIIRQDKYPLPSRTSAIQCQTSLISQLFPVDTIEDASQTIPSLQTLLRPLYALTDPSIPLPSSDNEAYKALSDRAQELLDLLQRKLGSGNFLAALAVTRAGAKTRREERRRKRRIEAVAAPEKREKGKRRRYEVKKAKQKAKGEVARGRRRGW